MSVKSELESRTRSDREERNLSTLLDRLLSIVLRVGDSRAETLRRGPGPRRAEAALFVALFVFLPIRGSSAAELTSRTDSVAGFTWSLPSEVVRVEIPFRHLAGSVPDDSFLVSIHASRRSLPFNATNGIHRAHYFVYFFPARSPKELESAREDRSKLPPDLRKELDSWLPLDSPPTRFHEYASSRLPDLTPGEREAKTFGNHQGRFERYAAKSKFSANEEHWLVGEFEIANGTVAIAATCPVNHVEKIQVEHARVVATFAPIAPEGLEVPDANAGVVRSLVPFPSLTVADRAKLYESARTREFERVKSEISPGYGRFDAGAFLVIHDCDRGYATETAKLANALLEWVDEWFRGIQRYPSQSLVLEVHLNKPGHLSDDAPWFGTPADVRRIQYFRPDHKTEKTDYAWLSVRALRYRLEQIRPGFWKRAPGWLRFGVEDFVGNADRSGSRLEFEADRAEAARFIELKATGPYQPSDARSELISIEQLYRCPPDHRYRAETGKEMAMAQATEFVRWIFEGKGNAAVEARGDFARWIEALADEIDRSGTNVLFESAAETVYRAAFDRTFKDRPSSSWTALDGQFWKWIASRK